MNNLTEAESVFVSRALGRLFILGSRPFQPGDIEEFEKIREVVMTLCGTPDDVGYLHDYHRDMRRNPHLEGGRKT